MAVFVSASNKLAARQRRMKLTRLNSVDKEVPVLADIRLPHRGSPFLFASSTGARVWPGSNRLSHLLRSEEHMRVIASKAGRVWKGWQETRVLELGCGLGLCSIEAARQGACHVIATDGDPSIVELVRKNLAHNGFESCSSTSVLRFFPLAIKRR